MKIIQKCAAVLCIAAIGAASFCGCGKKESGLKTVEVWSHDSHSRTIMNELVNKWNENEGKKLGVKLNYTVKEGDIQQATEMAFASNQGPDLFSSCKVEKNRAAGNIISFEDIEGGKEWIAENYNEEDYKNNSEFMGDDGKIYTLPNSILTFGLVYNKDMFKKYGIVDENGEPTPPETFDQVREYAKKMTNPAEQDYGIVFPMKRGGFCSTDVLSLALGSSGRTEFDCKTGKYDFSNIKPIVKMYAGILEDGSCFPGSETLDNDMARAYFAERNIGMKFAGSYDVGVFNSQFPAKCDWGVAPYPVENAGEHYKQKMIIGGGYGMSKACVEKVGDKAALEILKFFYGDELARELYKDGMALCPRSEVMKDITPKADMKGWKEFADLVAVSTGGYRGASTDLTGEKDLQQTIVQDIFGGTVKDIDKALDDLAVTYNKAVEKYYKENADKDINTVINPDWNIKLD